jgi:hypothetical protein
MKNKLDRFLVIEKLGRIRSILLIIAVAFFLAAAALQGAPFDDVEKVAWEYEVIARLGVFRPAVPLLIYAGSGVALLALAVEIAKRIYKCWLL